jgi:hypothetical protein
VSDRRYSFVTLESPDVMGQVIEAALNVLRPHVHNAWIDAVSERAWPEDRRADVAALLELEKQGQRKQSGLGIRMDLTDDAQLSLMARLAPYSVSAEAWGESGELFSAQDSGDQAWFFLTAAQASETAKRLADVGLAFESVLDYRG